MISKTYQKKEKRKKRKEEKLPGDGKEIPGSNWQGGRGKRERGRGEGREEGKVLDS